MNTLRTAVDEYLAMRRALGFTLRDVGYRLRSFVAFAETEGAEFVTTALALSWAKQPAHATPAHRAARLGAVRQFARYRSAADPRTEIPPDGLLPHRYRRRAPYLYRDDEIAKLLAAAQDLPSPRGLRSHTYATLFGLLPATGLRISEALALDRDDVDLRASVLTIRRTKFGKTRYVPIHATTRRALRRYARCRDQVFPSLQTPAFLVSERRARVTQSVARWTFVKLSHQIGLRGPADRRGPRLHDFRHGFALQTLIRWYRSGVDVERYLPRLSTYLGHVHVADTYWYLSATPELLRLASRRLDEPKEGGLS